MYTVYMYIVNAYIYICSLVIFCLLPCTVACHVTRVSLFRMTLCNDVHVTIKHIDFDLTVSNHSHAPPVSSPLFPFNPMKVNNGGVRLSTEQAWFCSMNPDPVYSCCTVRQQPLPPVSSLRKQGLDFVFSVLPVGSLVSAKIRGYPWYVCVYSALYSQFMNHQSKISLKGL